MDTPAGRNKNRNNDLLLRKADTEEKVSDLFKTQWVTNSNPSTFHSRAESVPPSKSALQGFNTLK